MINEFGEKLEMTSGLTLNLEYWDCECDTNIIHSVRKKACEICKSIIYLQPNSRESEVLIMINR